MGELRVLALCSALGESVLAGFARKPTGASPRKVPAGTLPTSSCPPSDMVPSDMVLACSERESASASASGASVAASGNASVVSAACCAWKTTWPLRAAFARKRWLRRRAERDRWANGPLGRSSVLLHSLPSTSALAVARLPGADGPGRSGSGARGSNGAALDVNVPEYTAAEGGCCSAAGIA